VKPETMEKVVAVAGTLSGCMALVGCAAYVLGNPLAIVGAAAGIVLTAVCAGCLAGMQIGRNMVPVATAQPVALAMPADVAHVPAYAPRPLPASPAPVLPAPAPVVETPRLVPVKPMRFDVLPHGPIETPMPMPVVKLPLASGTFEMSKAHIDALNGLCDAASTTATQPTVEIDPVDLRHHELEDSYATIPMRFVDSEDGPQVQMLRW
jgi:hypothetical protein